MSTENLTKRIGEAQAYWRLVLAHKWHILVGTFALTLAFTVFIAKLPSTYEATTTILVDPQQIPEKYVSPAVSNDPYSQLNTITQQVLSRTRLQEIINKFELYPELRKSRTPEEIVEKMRDDIAIQVKQGSGLELSTFTISYQAKLPLVVAEVANELAASFIQWNVDSREEQVTGTKEFLTSELRAAKRSLEQQEDQLRQFKMHYLGETPDQAPNNLQALAGLRAALQANSDSMNRLDEEKTLLTSLPESSTTNANPTVVLTERGRLELQKRQLEANLGQLRQRYADSYPDIVMANGELKEITSRLKSLPSEPVDPTKMTDEPSAAAVRLQVIDQQMKKLKSQQDQIESQITGYQSKLDDTPLREEQLVELTRNYDISKQNYQDLLDKSFSIDMAADLEQKQKGERFTVLDAAQVPQKPVKPARKMLIPLAGFAAFALSVFCVFAGEALNPAIKTESELKTLLPKGAKVMGLIPHISIEADARRNQRIAISASLISILLCLALIHVILEIRAVL